MDHKWQQDPRLKSMNPEKIKFLTDFAEQTANIRKDQLFNRLLSLSMEAEQQNISFTNQETALVTEILFSHMNPLERKKLDMLRMLSRR